MYDFLAHTNRAQRPVTFALPISDFHAHNVEERDNEN